MPTLATNFYWERQQIYVFAKFVLFVLCVCIPQLGFTASEGPNSGATFTSDSSNGGTASWTNPGNASASDDVDASSEPAGETTHYLKATNFSFDLPDGATIDGIVVEVEKRQPSGGACRGDMQDNGVRIVKGGTIGSTDRSSAVAWSSTDAYTTYGGVSDLWGETWSVSDIEASTFGFAFAAEETDDDDCAITVDHIRMTVHYTEGGGGGGGTFEITGTVYTDEGSTTIGANKTVDLSLHGDAPAFTDETDAGGQYTITGVTSGTGVLTLFLDDETEDAVTITMGSGSNMTGVHLYQNRLILRSETGSTIVTNSHLAEADNSGDADLDSIFTVDGSNILRVRPDKELYVWSGSYAQTTYTPAARVVGHDLEVLGTMNMSTNGLVLTGSIITQNGTFTTSTGVHLLYGYTRGFPDAPETISMGINTFSDLVIDNGLIGYWKLDEGTGQVARDASFRQNHGTLTSMNDGSKKWTDGTPDVSFYNPYALEFDGSDDRIVVSDNAVLSPKHASVALWVKGPSQATKAAIAHYLTTGNQRSFWVGTSSAKLRVIISSDGTGSAVKDYNSSVDVFNDTWKHITFTFNGLNLRIFVDGVEDTSPTKTTDTGVTSLFDSTADLVIGGAATAGQYFDGLLDDVRYYNRELSTSEVSSLATGKPSSGSGHYILGSALDVNGKLQLYSTKLDVSSSNYAVNVAGDWINQGEFIKQSGTVTLDGTSQAMSGNTLFNALIKSVTSPDTLRFDYTSRQSVSGALTINGTTSNILSLRSNRTGSASKLVLDGESGTQTISYLNVQDNSAAGGATLACAAIFEECTDSGNTTNWSFADTSISGTVYSDEGSTTLGANETIGLSINGGAQFGADETDAGGSYVIAGLSATTGVFTLYLDDETEDGVTVTLGSGSSMTGVHLYQNRLIVRSETGGTITNTHLAIGDNNGDADILALYNVDGSNTVHMESDKELYVWDNTTYRTDGRVRGHDLDVRGTMTLNSNSLVLTGSIVTTNGTFTTSTGVLLQYGYTGAFTDSKETIDMGSNTFQDLTIESGLIGYWKMDEGHGFSTKDSSYFSHHGTLTNMNDGVKKWFGGSTSVSFYNPHSIEFDGTNDYVNIPYTAKMDVDDALCVSAWVRPDGGGSNDMVLSRMASANTTSNNLWFFGEASNVWYWWISADGGTTNRAFVSMETAPTNNVWSHVSACYDGINTKLDIYLNGTNVSSSVTGTIPSSVHDSSAVPIHIGKRHFNNGHIYYNGRIDEARVYNRILKKSELDELAAGSPSSGSGHYLLGSALDVNGDLQIYGAKLDVTSTNYAVNVAGGWMNQGEFAERSGTVTLDGSSQVMSGNTIFNALIKSVSSTDTITFDYTTRQSISGSLTITGADSNLLSLRSSKTGSASKLLLDGDSGTQTLEYLDVKDNDASGGAEMNCTTGSGCVDSGNTTNWFFGLLPTKNNYFFFFGF